MVFLVTGSSQPSDKMRAVQIQFQYSIPTLGRWSVVGFILFVWCFFFFLIHAWEQRQQQLLLPDLQQMLANKQLLMLADKWAGSKVQGHYIPSSNTPLAAKTVTLVHLFVSAWAAYSRVIKTFELSV